MDRRSNTEWLEALRAPGPARREALGDLHALLVRGLGFALSSYDGVRDSDLDDFAQEAVLKVVDALDTFRGESRFLTWATKIAVRVAYTEMRRARWRDVPLQTTIDTPDGEFLPTTYVAPGGGPEEIAVQRDVIGTLNEAIESDLTDRQRRALVSIVLQGMPLAEVARKMGSNRNAMYKLLHDARKRLRSRLEDRGLSADEILDAFSVDDQGGRLAGSGTPGTGKR